MKFHELYSIVVVEAISLFLIIVIIIAVFKRWRGILLTSTFLAAVAFFSAWSNIMAFASTLVYGSASTLLWWQVGENLNQTSNRKKFVQKLTWTILASGISILILNNLRNIFIYLGYH